MKLSIQLILLCLSISASAQLTNFTLDVTPSPSTCLQNGVLDYTVQGVNPAATITYTITRLSDNVVLAQDITANSFGGLLPDDYEVTATQTLGGESNMQSMTVAVADAFAPLEYELQLTDELCGTDGTIEIVTSQGNFESVEIVSGPLLVGPQPSILISGLIQGDYVLEIIDICGNKSFVSATLVRSSNEFTATNIFESGLSRTAGCNSEFFRYGLRLIDNASGMFATPVIFEYVVSPPTSLGLPDSTFTYVEQNPYNLQHEIPLFDKNLDHNVNILITDACGFTYEIDYVMNRNLSGGARSLAIREGCGVGIDIYIYNLREPYSIEFLESPSGFDPIFLILSTLVHLQVLHIILTKMYQFQKAFIALG